MSSAHRLASLHLSALAVRASALACLVLGCSSEPDPATTGETASATQAASSESTASLSSGSVGTVDTVSASASSTGSESTATSTATATTGESTVTAAQARADAGRHIAVVDRYPIIANQGNYKDELLMDTWHPNEAAHALRGAEWFRVLEGSW